MPPLITDPAFYALAVPAVLLIGLAKSGFMSGFGALATPMVALAVTVPEAAAIMLPLLLVADAVGLRALWRERDRALLRELLPWGLVGMGLGALAFHLVSAQALSGIVGAITLLFLLQRLWSRAAARRASARAGSAPADAAAHGAASAGARRWLGPACGGAAGFTSFLLHAGSPPLHAYLLPKRLAPLVFGATNGVFFATMNLCKVLPYAAMGLWDTRNFMTSLLLLPLAPLGVWLGLWLTRRVSAEAFYALAYLGMAATGTKLLWDGLR